MTTNNGPKKTKINLISNLRYRDCNKAVSWLCEAFGFHQHNVFKDEKGNVVHAELSFGNGMIMIGPVADTPFGKFMLQPEEAGGRETQCCYVIVENPDAHYEQSKKCGARTVYLPEDKSYGGRDYGCFDFEGHLWSFGTYDPFA